MNGEAWSVQRVCRAARWHLRETRTDAALERVREWIEQRDARRLLAEARAGRDVCWPDSAAASEPLVTIRIPTYRRADLLMERSLPSALRQSYERVEILVVGDHTDAATDRYMGTVRDPRVRYLNLPRQGNYPKDPESRWRVSGTAPMNAATLLAEGAWITHCDDDDELTADHVEVLLAAATERRLEFVHSRTASEQPDGSWAFLGTERLASGQVTQGATLYSMGLAFMSYSATCWKLKEAHDWNLFRRMAEIGVVMGFVDQVTYRYRRSERLDG